MRSFYDPRRNRVVRNKDVGKPPRGLPNYLLVAAMMAAAAAILVYVTLQ